MVSLTATVLALVLGFCYLASGSVIIDPAEIEYIGRWDLSNPSAPRADWSGVQIRAVFSNTKSVQAAFGDGFNYQNGLNIDITNSAGANIYTVFFNMTQMNWNSPALNPSQSYTITVTKRTEAVIGYIVFKGFTADAAAIVKKPTPRERRIEVVGDSITCGFGDLGHTPCGFTAQTEDETKAYGWLVGEAVNAETHVIAWNGKGLMRNWNDPGITGNFTMTRYWGYTLATVDTSDTWNFASWIPDAVVINLGTNDYATQPNPPQDVFVNGYVGFVKRILNNYSSKPPKVFLVCGPMIANPCCQYVQDAATALKATYIDMKNILVDPTDIGCASHPNVSGHQKMANIAIPAIKKEMNW